MAGWVLMVYCDSVDLVVFTYFGFTLCLDLIYTLTCCSGDFNWLLCLLWLWLVLFGCDLFWWLVIGIVCFGLCLNCCVRLVVGGLIDSCFADGSCWYLLFVGLSILFVYLLNYLLLFCVSWYLIWFVVLCGACFVCFVLLCLVGLCCGVSVLI